MKNAFNLVELQKKGSAGINHTLTYIMEGVFSVVIVLALSPTIYASIESFVNGTVGAPAYVGTLLTIGVSIGLVFLVLSAFGLVNKR